MLSAAVLLAAGAERLRLPGLLGMILAGVAVGMLPWPPATEQGLAVISEPVRTAILTIVLLRAGLGLSREDLQRAGSFALLLGTIPLLADATAVTLAAHWLLQLPWSSAFVLGFLVAAISPAIVIPTLLERLQTASPGQRSTLTPLLAGAPIDNVTALFGLGIALDIAGGKSEGWMDMVVAVPFSLLGGVAAGLGLGHLLVWAMKFRTTQSSAGWHTVLLIGSSAALVALGQSWNFSYALAIIVAGAVVRDRSPNAATAIGLQLGHVWVYAKYALFAFIGAAVNLAPLAAVGLAAVATIALGQLGRAVGSWAITARRGLSRSDRWQALAVYMPKATIQAAFAGAALDQGLVHGELILSVGVLAIVLCAPAGILAMRPSNRHPNRGTSRPTATTDRSAV